MSGVVGLDLGYQNSVIASAGRGGVDVILNGNSNRLNPSMVGFDENRKVGEQSASGVFSNYKNTIEAMKRLVGLPYDCPRARHEMTFCIGVTFVPVKHSKGGHDSIGVKVTLNGEELVVSIEAVLGSMVKHMGEIVARKAAADSDIKMYSTTLQQFFPPDWVVAIPNYYTDAQRRAVIAGCEIVGITGVQRLMHENTATALAYGIFKDLKKEFSNDKATNVMFIDMGASAYTVSIVSYVPGKLIVKAAHCDADLGGRDFDTLVATWISDEFVKKYGKKLSGNPMDNPKTRLKLLANAEKAKKTLSPAGVQMARLNLEMLMDDLDFSIALNSDTYEAMCAPLLSKLEPPIQNALKEAELKASDLAAVEIVGGSTRIGCIKRRLMEILGVDSLSTTMNADESVARGAALQSAILSPRFKVLPYEIQEAQPYPVKVSWADDNKASGVEVNASGEANGPTDSVVMFERGMNFPVVKRVTLTREGDFTVKACYEESAVQQYALPPPVEIAEFHIKGATSSSGDHKVRVNVKQDIHGIVTLSSVQMVETEEEPAPAEEQVEEASTANNNKKEGEETAEKKKKKTKKTNLEFTIVRPLEWTPAEINKANEAEVHMANNDRIVRERADARNELESYIYDMRDKVASESQLSPFGTDDEKDAFLSANEKTETWLYEDGFDASKSVYTEKLAQLKKLGAPMEIRQREAHARAGAVSQLKTNLEMYQKWVNESQTQERYAHITDEEREKVREMTDNISGWMYEMLDQQGGLAPNQDPVLTVAVCTAKNLELANTCSPIMNKKIPPPPKKEPVPAAEEAKKEDPPAAAAGDAEPMEGVEPESGEPTKMEVDSN